MVKGALAICPHCGGKHRTGTKVRKCRDDKKRRALKWDKDGQKRG